MRFVELAMSQFLRFAAHGPGAPAEQVDNHGRSLHAMLANASYTAAKAFGCGSAGMVAVENLKLPSNRDALEASLKEEAEIHACDLTPPNKLDGKQYPMGNCYDVKDPLSVSPLPTCGATLLYKLQQNWAVGFFQLYLGGRAD